MVATTRRGKGRPANGVHFPLDAKLVAVDGPFAVGEDRDVGGRTDGQRAAGQAEDARGIGREQLDEARQRQIRQCRRVGADRNFEPAEPRRESVAFFALGVRRVIAGERIDRAVVDGLAQRRDVVGRS